MALGGLTTEQKNNLANYLSEETFREGEILFNEGEPITEAFFLKRGSVQLFSGDQEIKATKGKECFDEVSVYRGKPWSMKGVALEQTTCITLPMKIVLNLFGTFHSVMMANALRLAIRNSQIIRLLPQLLIEKILKTFETKEVPKNYVVQEPFSYMERLVVVCEGVLIDESDQKATQECEIFKEENLREENFNKM